MYLQSCAWTYNVNKNDQHKRTYQTNGSRNNKNLRVHFFDKNGDHEYEKSETYKKIDAKLQIFVGYPLFKILVRKKQYYQDYKEGHGFGKGNTSGKINNVRTGKPSKEKLNGQW